MSTKESDNKSRLERLRSNVDSGHYATTCTEG